METNERARTNTQIILQGVAKTGLESIAAAISRDVSTVSRMKENELPRLAMILAVCELKIVPQDNRCVSPEKMQALKSLAQMALNHPTADSLIWDE